MASSENSLCIGGRRAYGRGHDRPSAGVLGDRDREELRLIMRDLGIGRVYVRGPGGGVVDGEVPRRGFEEAEDGGD